MHKMKLCLLEGCTLLSPTIPLQLPPSRCIGTSSPGGGRYHSVWPCEERLDTKVLSFPRLLLVRGVLLRQGVNMIVADGSDNDLRLNRFCCFQYQRAIESSSCYSPNLSRQMYILVIRGTLTVHDSY